VERAARNWSSELLFVTNDPAIMMTAVELVMCGMFVSVVPLAPVCR